MTKKISIIGLGWLGIPLARRFLGKGWQVYGSTRDSDKADRLKREGFNVSAYDVYEPNIAAQLDEGFFKDTVLMMNIAVGRRDIDAAAYAAAAQGLIRHAYDNGARHVLFISTSSVFGALDSKTQLIELDEDSCPSPSSNSGIAHAQIESFLMSEYSTSSAVLRLAGLIGPNPDYEKREDDLIDDKGQHMQGKYRHPVYFLSKRKHVNGGSEAVNLVHRDDALNIIESIILQAAFGRIYHACAQEHPSRKSFYQHAARKFGLNIPAFESSLPTDAPASQGKTIACKKSIEHLGLSLKYPSPFDF